MPRRTREEQGLSYDCSVYLRQRWDEIRSRFEAPELDELIEPLAPNQEMILLIRDCLQSTTLSYHYVLPTQLLAKAVNPALDAHAVQAGYSGSGAFDARSIAHDVIVPFDRDHERVLGGSPEPYVNNPLRVPGITQDHRGPQKNKADWDKLVTVLDAVEASSDSAFARTVFDQVLVEIYRMLDRVTVAYPTPSRISLERTNQLLDEFLAAKSGGERMEAVCAALFRIIGKRFALFDEVRREKVTSSDVSTGMSGDIECLLDGKVVLVVEVKDREITLVQLDTTLDAVRARHITELLVIAEHGKEAHSEDVIDVRIRNEFTSGQNVYVVRFADFALGILILFGEDGRVEFLNAVGTEMERVNARIEHRRAWADLLRRA